MIGGYKLTPIMDHDNEFIIIVFPLTFDIFYQ